MHNHDELLKTDVLGRVRTSRQRREALLEEFSKSGVSASKFAQMAGINYQTFATWVQKQKQRRRQAEGTETDAPAKPLQWSLVEALPVVTVTRSAVGMNVEIPCACRWVPHIPIKAATRSRRGYGC